MSDISLLGPFWYVTRFGFLSFSMLGDNVCIPFLKV